LLLCLWVDRRQHRGMVRRRICHTAYIDHYIWHRVMLASRPAQRLDHTITFQIAATLAATTDRHRRKADCAKSIHAPASLLYKLQPVHPFNDRRPFKPALPAIVACAVVFAKPSGDTIAMEKVLTRCWSMRVVRTTLAPSRPLLRSCALRTTHVPVPLEVGVHARNDFKQTSSL